MGKVISGEYTGCKVCLSKKYNCLYVKYNGGAIPIDSIRVESCKLKNEDKRISEFDNLVLVEWINGSKSIMKIEESLLPAFINGYENLVIEKPGKLKANWSLIMWSTVVTLIVAFIVAVAENPVSNAESGGMSKNIKQWATWDGEGEAPNAKVVVMTADVKRNDYILEYGEIYGMAYNRSGSNINYMQITYGIYAENGNKISSCFTNQTNISHNTGWEFKAQCIDLPSTAFKYRVDEVTYW